MKRFLIWVGLTLGICGTAYAQLLSPIVNFGGPRFVSTCPTNTQATAFFNRLATKPTSARQTLYCTLFASLVSGGIYSNLDVLYLFGAADQATALTNLISSSYTASPVNSPTFTTDRGIAGDGTSSYINTNFIPNTAGGNYSLNSAHISVWDLTNRNTSTTGDNVIGVSDGTNYSLLSPYYTGTFNGLLNEVVDNSYASANSLGFFLVNRSGVTAVQLAINGATVYSGSPASTAIPVVYPFFIGARDNYTVPGQMSSDQIAAASIGGSLTSGQITSFYNALYAFFHSVGVV